MSWRGEARAALRAYPRLKQRQSDLHEMQITPVYGGAAVQHSASRTTEEVALRPVLTDDELNVISAVELMFYMQSHYYNYDARRKMIQTVYFSRRSRKEATLEHAAEVCGYSAKTVKNWNTEILTAVYVGLKKRVPLQAKETIS